MVSRPLPSSASRTRAARIPLASTLRASVVPGHRCWSARCRCGRPLMRLDTPLGCQRRGLCAVLFVDHPQRVRDCGVRPPSARNPLETLKKTAREAEPTTRDISTFPDNLASAESITHPRTQSGQPPWGDERHPLWKTSPGGWKGAARHPRIRSRIESHSASRARRASSAASAASVHSASSSPHRSATMRSESGP